MTIQTEALNVAFDALRNSQDYKMGRAITVEAVELIEESLAQRTWVGLTDEDRQSVFESLPDMLDGFLNKWGWLHFAKAIEAKLRELNEVK